MGAVKAPEVLREARNRQTWYSKTEWCIYYTSSKVMTLLFHNRIPRCTALRRSAGRHRVRDAKSPQAISTTTITAYFDSN